MDRTHLLLIISLIAIILTLALGFGQMRVDSLRTTMAKNELDQKFQAEVLEKLSYQTGILDGLAVSMSPYPREIKKLK